MIRLASWVCHSCADIVSKLAVMQTCSAGGGLGGWRQDLSRALQAHLYKGAGARGSESAASGAQVCLVGVESHLRDVCWSKPGKKVRTVLPPASAGHYLIFEQHKGQAPWLLCRGIKGVSFSDGLDKREACPQRPAYGSPEIETSPYAEVHCSIHRLLAGVKAAEVDPKTTCSGVCSAAQHADFDFRMLLQGTPADSRLRASEESLQQALSAAPMFMQNLSLLLRCLNVFSFS